MREKTEKKIVKKVGKGEDRYKKRKNTALVSLLPRKTINYRHNVENKRRASKAATQVVH